MGGKTILRNPEHWSRAYSWSNEERKITFPAWLKHSISCLRSFCWSRRRFRVVERTLIRI